MNETVALVVQLIASEALGKTGATVLKAAIVGSKLERDILLKLNRVGEHVLVSLVSHVHATPNAVLAIASGWNGDPGGTVSMETRNSVGKEISQDYVNTNKLLFAEEGLAWDQQLKLRDARNVAPVTAHGEVGLPGVFAVNLVEVASIEDRDQLLLMLHVVEDVMGHLRLLSLVTNNVALQTVSGLLGRTGALVQKPVEVASRHARERN